MRYTIKALFPLNGGLVEHVLGENNRWYAAANRIQAFQTIDQARRYIEKHRIVENRPTLGTESCPYIVGPKGGRYSVFNKG